MPPQLASLLTWGFIIWLFRRDLRQTPKVTSALWLPLIWMVIICSRAASELLSLMGLPVPGGASLEGGSPVDALISFGLIIAGGYVLGQRRVSVAEVIRNNGWLVVFLVYSFISIAWSDFSFVAFKRWIKILGHPIMVLIILTEPDPVEALKRLMKRCAYIIVPISILFIKYYPQWGRSFSEWTGAAENNGIAPGKNMLGADCFILGSFFVWNFLNVWKTSKSKARRNELLLNGGFLYMIGWLLYMAHSSTSYASLGICILVMTFVSLRIVNKQYIGTYILSIVAVLAVAEFSFGISDYVIAGLGRDTTLTGRTELWHILWNFDVNPIIGTGFESFWLGERFKKIGEMYWWQANEAHNGYLEMYLNLGGVGVLLVVGWIFGTFWKIKTELLRNPELGKLRLGFLIAIVIYNWTEAAYKSLHPVYFLLFIIAVDYPITQVAPEPRAVEVDEVEPETEPELVSGG